MLVNVSTEEHKCLVYFCYDIVYMAIPFKGMTVLRHPDTLLYSTNLLTYSNTAAGPRNKNAGIHQIK
jgi:hypothetical protein